jgi:predicted peptidase
VVAGVPHHVTQRGNRRQLTFFKNEEGETMSRAWIAGLVVAAALAAAAEVRAAEETDPAAAVFEARVYRDATGGQLAYRLMKPADYDAGKKYPLVVFLHGSGERGADNAAQLKNGVKEFLGSAEARAKYPCFALVPQCPPDDSWSAPTFPESGLNGASRRVLEVIQALQKEFSIDAERLYVGGLSMGGFGTWDLISRYPEFFAAAFPICGGGVPARAPLVKDIPVWVFQGGADPAVPPKMSQEMVAAIQKAGGKPKYTEYPGVGHNSWTNAFKEPELLAWLFAQKRGAPASMKAAVLPPVNPPAGWPAKLPSQGTWSGTLNVTSRKAPRLVVEETHFRLKPSDTAGADAKALLEKVADGQLKGACQVTGTAVYVENRLWLLVDSMKPLEPAK